MNTEQLIADIEDLINRAEEFEQANRTFANAPSTKTLYADAAIVSAKMSHQITSELRQILAKHKSQ
jgi:hypothetical protein